VARPAGLKITSFGAEALFDGMPGFFPARGNAAFQHEISVLHRAFDSGSMAADNSSKRAANRMPEQIACREIIRITAKSSRA